MEEDTPDEEIEAGLRIGLRQALAGEGRPALEMLEEIRAEDERCEAAVTVKGLTDVR